MLTEITALPAENNVQVRSVTPEYNIIYKLYGPEQKDQFLTEVEGAAEYVTIMGW